MKTLHTKPSLSLYVALPTLTLSICLYIFFAQYVTYFFYINWACTLTCLYLLFQPKSNQLLNFNNEKTNINLNRTLLKIWFFQILLILTYLGFMQILSRFAPTNTNIQTPISNTFTHLFGQYGLYPWTSYAMLSLLLAKRTFWENKETHFSNLSTHHAKSASAIIINGSMRLPATTIICFNMAWMAYYLATLYMTQTTHLQTKWNTGTLIVCTFCLAMLILCSSKRLYSKTLLKRTHITTYIIAFTATLSLIISFISSIITITNPSTITPPTLLTFLQHYSWQDISNIASYCWWTLWIPVISLYCARTCKNLSIRESLVVLLSLPVIIAIIFYSLPSAVIANFSLWVIHSTSLAWTSMAVLVTLLTIITNQKHRSNFLLCSLSEQDNPKFRPHSDIQRTITCTLIILMLFITMGDIYFSNIALVISTGFPLGYTVYSALTNIPHFFNRPVATTNHSDTI